MLPNAKAVRAALDYNPDTGRLIFRPRGNRRFDGRFAGRLAFNSLDAHGYCQGQLLGAMRKAHRVAWVHYHGEWPVGEVDHINGDRADNRIVNLRCVTASENRRNMRPRRDMPLGVYKKRSKWGARIRVDGKDHYLGVFATIEEAAAVRREAQDRFGFHPNHGVPVAQGVSHE